MLLRSACIGLVLAIGAGVIARASASEPTHLQAQLTELPMLVSGWSGATGTPFESDILDVLGVDEYVNRTYRDGTQYPVSLYVGFYGSQSEGDTMHSPMNCLPGSGWQPVDRTYRDLQVQGPSGPQTVRVNEILIENGGQRQVVLYWYQSQGRVVASEYWSKVFTVVNAIRTSRSDGAIVRVVAPVIDGQAQAADAAARFASAMFPHLFTLLPL